MTEYSDAITQEWEHKAWTNLHDLITTIPRELMKKLYLENVRDLRNNIICSERGRVDANIRDLYVQAMKSCEKGREQIAELRKILNNTEENINRDMVDLRNNYPTPYDSEDLVKAWRYANRNRKRVARFFEVNPSSVEECKKAYEKFCGLFYGHFHDVPCHIKTFIQSRDERYGEIEFYVDGIVGDFHLDLPQNHMLEYGNLPCGSMNMSVLYSAPDCSGYTTGYYRTVAESYDLGELAALFKSAIEAKKGLDCDLRMMDHYIALAENRRKEVEDYCAKNGKTYEKFIEEMKDSIMKATKGEIG